MKKLFLFLSLSVLALSISSCSDDDSSSTNDTNTSFVKFKVDGVQKNFTDVSVEKVENNGPVYYIVIARNTNDTTERVEMTFDEYSVEETYFNFVYYYAGLSYEYFDTGSAFVSDIQVYNENQIKGFFSATLPEIGGSSEEPVFKVFTEGSFDIKITE